MYRYSLYQWAILLVFAIFAFFFFPWSAIFVIWAFIVILVLPIEKTWETIVGLIFVPLAIGLLFWGWSDSSGDQYQIKMVSAIVTMGGLVHPLIMWFFTSIGLFALLNYWTQGSKGVIITGLIIWSVVYFIAAGGSLGGFDFFNFGSSRGGYKYLH